MPRDLTGDAIGDSGIRTPGLEVTEPDADPIAPDVDVRHSR